MGNLKFDYSKALESAEIEALSPFVAAAHKMLEESSGAGSDFLGWLRLPGEFDRAELERIKAAAARVRSNSEIFVVIGIGGSYLGAKAAIDMLGHNFSASLPKEKRGAPKVVFAGNSVSSTYLADLVEVLEDVDFSINIISKSGTTIEPAITFRVLRELLLKKYGREGARTRIYATADTNGGALKKLSEEEGYERFVIPADIGGRFSVLTAVGLFPIAVSGGDVDGIFAGAREAMEKYGRASLEDNISYQYAAARNALYRKGKTLEVFVSYEPQMHFFSEWWKQLYGESEGKDGKGIFPVSADFSTDLHSIGQYIQQGLRNMFETSINVETPRKDIEIKADRDNIDGLNFLAGKTIDFVNSRARLGTLLAHTDGGVPNLVLQVPRLDEANFGEMVYFFERACGVSGYLLGVNPFDQPGVENYKRNMFALLGKPGHERQRRELEERLGASEI